MVRTTSTTMGAAAVTSDAMPAGAVRADAARLYERHARAADRGRWSVERDVRWADVDPALADPPVLDALREGGVRVLLPVLREDDDLDWGTYEGPGALVETERAGRMRLREPAGERLGREAVLAAEAH